MYLSRNVVTVSQDKPVLTAGITYNQYGQIHDNNKQRRADAGVHVRTQDISANAENYSLSTQVQLFPGNKHTC